MAFWAQMSADVQQQISGDEERGDDKALKLFGLSPERSVLMMVFIFTRFIFLCSGLSGSDVRI